MQKRGEIFSLSTEMLAGLLTALDVVALYSDYQKSASLVLSIWTGILHMIFLLLGFLAGEWITSFIVEGGRLFLVFFYFLQAFIYACTNKNLNLLSFPPCFLLLLSALIPFQLAYLLYASITKMVFLIQCRLFRISLFIRGAKKQTD